MPLDENSGWALIPGSKQPKETAKMKVKCVLRFWYEGKLVDKGEVVEVDDSVGREVIASGKAVAAADKPASASRTRSARAEE